MNDKNMLAAMKHAEDCYPDESCGLLVIVKGKERYLPCRNIAIDDRCENFAVHPEDYTAAEDLGEITALVHSHVESAAIMGDADKVMCALSGLPWYLISVSKQTGDVMANEPVYFESVEYEAPLVGRQFTHGILDCYALIRDYFKREFQIELPDFERKDKWWDNGENLYMGHFAEAGFEPIKGAIQTGDVIIMQMRAPVPNHAGVYIGDGRMLHHMYQRLSTRDHYLGYYQEVTRVIVRHKDLQK